MFANLLQLNLLILLALQLMVHASSAVAELQCRSEFEAIAAKAIVISRPGADLREGSNKEFSLMHHLTELAHVRKVGVHSLVDRASVAVVLSDQLAADIKASWNTSLEVLTAKNLAFVAKLDCSKGAADICNRIRGSCASPRDHRIFLLSAYCSESVTCSPIGSQIGLDGKQSVPPGTLGYIAFRLLERQLFIARELGELWFEISFTSEYLIQQEIQDAHGSRLSNDGTPVAMFVTWPTKSPAYYHILNLFLDAALSLKKLFSFHIADAQLSQIREQSQRPTYRYEFESHQAHLALFTKDHCQSAPDWAFNCKPIVATADSLLTSEQFSGFLVHQILKEQSARSDVSGILPYPAFFQKTFFMEAFAALSDTYVLGVAADETAMKNTLLDWERMRDILVVLEGNFGLTFYPLVLTKPLAMDLTTGLDSGVEISGACEKLCFIIRMPGTDFGLFGPHDPMMKLDSAVRDAIDRSQSYRESIQLSLHNIEFFNRGQLPSALTTCGHLFGGDCTDETASFTEQSDDDPSPHDIDGVDAFVEQSKFNEIYNTTGILVVDKSQELFDSFLLLLDADRPWLVLFTVPWSPVCKAARAIWSAVNQCVKRAGMQDVQLVKLDCFEANQLCSYLKVNTYPTVAMYKRGTKLSEYAGPISVGRLCAFAHLALSPPVLHSQSSEKTRDLLETFLPLMSRAFVISGPEISSSVITLALEMQFKDVFIFEELTDRNRSSTFAAFYHESFPASRQFTGDINDSIKLMSFITRGHLYVIFPCSWAYLAEAVNSARPLIVLFHTTSVTDYLDILKNLGNQFIEKGASVCHLKLHRHHELDDLVQKIAGHSLPALVLLTGDRSALHRLPLGPIPAGALIAEASEWARKGLGGELTGEQSIETNPEPWKPAHPVYNFVEQVYRGKVNSNNKSSGNRFGRVLSNRPFASNSERKEDTINVVKSPIVSAQDKVPNGVIHEEL
ncbi:hypothetical protein BOX15_Mlig011394g1 [Macrostomum lignano]|uniref:Thioredoxin domain-containing protein n=1 Tax=Macrostomum lignano TaxID=282301 RepID=A0A267GPK6_9PLAT|nr:hypothetical protein BOX15_Mlig011394g2 [Macrostomum lignano]PAA87239.1 hypothetical protein BOX15_Mlig011394g1 [Macrostomum lignano]